MSASAQVHSIELLKRLRAVLARFGVDAQAALETGYQEILRVQSTLENRFDYWRQQGHKRQEELAQARGSLAHARALNKGQRVGCLEQELAVRKAEERLREAEGKLMAVRRWQRELPEFVKEFEGPARSLSGLVEANLRHSLVLLDNKIAALEGYLAVATGNAPASGSARVLSEPAARRGPRNQGVVMSMTSAAVDLSNALKTVDLAWEEVREGWKDAVSRDFEANQWAPWTTRRAPSSGPWTGWARSWPRRCATVREREILSRARPASQACRMNEPSLIGRQRTLLRDLVRLTAEKAEAEPALAHDFLAEKDAAEEAFEDACENLRKRFTADKDALDRKLRMAREGIESRWTTEQTTAQKDYREDRGDLSDQLDVERDRTDAAFQEAKWTAEAVFDGAKNNAATKLREETARLAGQWKDLQTLCQSGRALMDEWNQPAGAIEEYVRQNPKPEAKPRKIEKCLEEARGYLAALKELVVPRFLKGKRLLWLALAVWFVLIFPLGWIQTLLLQTDNFGVLVGLGVVVSALVTFAAEQITRLVLGSMARKQTHALYLPLCELPGEVEFLREMLLKRCQTEHDHTIREAQKRYRAELLRAQSLQRELDEIADRRTTGFAKLEERLESQLAASEQRRAGALQAADKRHKQDSAHLVLMYETDMRQLDADYRAQTAEIDSRHLGHWQELVEKWQQELKAVQDGVVEVGEESDALFPGWDSPLWQEWRPPSALPPAMRFGAYQVSAESVVEDVPWDGNRPEPDRFDLTLPALCSFPEPASILFHAHDEGRDQAVEALQTVMFRLLTSLPPGRVRFLIVDPVGLGQNFATFMNLADYDEALVGSRIWTEATHIEQRLADLTGHMENVIQKYLRNRYATISEYNTYAGEVAEPFRVLVVANFPANFTTEAARRLVSIAQSGPRCGVSTLISIDTRQTVPKGFELADLERCGENLEWNEGRFHWRDEDFAPYPLTLDHLPENVDFCNRILHQVGEGAKNAQRVEVPFEFIAPTPEQWWKGSTRQGVSVPLGRAGATRRQLMELGKGTSQHVLIVGKTGSGKSTLLHALITNLALFYSPDEVELYLVDFKKGVEFKTYASHGLPHARVVAIESEREFGLSVLQRLDVELQGRGERFRAAGAQDLNSYRQALPEARSPRVLLIVDEFQEFFVEDDRIAHEAGQLLDRLVRQGRAFGMHILLGSQTIGGAFSLARSTIDQMAVRIALQCSEADAALILSDDNSAARLLSRPGEAIYNNANGLVEGNDPFQVVWLSEAQREQYLLRIHELAEERPLKPRPPAVVFEGNAAADVTKNDLLNRVLAAPPTREEILARGELAWLGEAMAIDELTAAVFRRQNGSNLLIVGQQPEAAMGMLTTGVISLAAHSRPMANGVSTPRFYVVDGNQPDSPRSGPLARLPEVAGEAMRVVGWRELASVLQELTAELDRRQKGSIADAPAVYLILYGLQRMRDLRKAEDDFGFGRAEEKPATPDKQLTALLREGSALGIHTLVWCDTLNNLQRAFDRQTMRELTMRVVFQLSVADSSNLIDNPAASKLGMHRALFASEEDGRLEKFRPYGLPSDEWLDWVREQFQQQ